MIGLPPRHEIAVDVGQALAEDVGSGDVTAALVGDVAEAGARVICRESGVLCGSAWFDEALHQVDPDLLSQWHRQDGDDLDPDDVVVTITGSARTLLTAERTALNFLQLLSGVATAARRHAAAVAGTRTRILDTRKTIPGLRLAQKYAVRVGGAHNHRIGLFDAFLIKENHIKAAGSITAAVRKARRDHPALPLEVEVEAIAQIDEAILAGVDRIMLDNFDLGETAAAVRHVAGRAELEASGGLGLDDLRALAETGVDYISIGALTKHLRALDFSLRF